tara:strand:- start:753 stop:992 length:240 start_codon:yes stop_codon:yes gene_type:complete
MEDTDDVLEKINAILAEHSMNYAFAILDEDGDLRYDYSNWRVGKMLFADSLIDMSQEMMMLEDAIWGEAAEEDEDEDYE